MKFKFDIEYEITPIRFVKATCPNCEATFDAREHGKCEGGGSIHDAVDLQYAKFKCPHCRHQYETRDKELDLTER